MSFGKAKMWAAAVGGTLTAVTTFVAAVQVALADGGWDASEYGTIATAVVVLIGTVRAVWQVENKPLNSHNIR